MTEIERLRDLLHRAVHGDAWHGPSLLEALDGVSAAQAAARPLAQAHTIAEIAAHADAWQRIVAGRVAGERAREMTLEEDWPAPAASEEEWSGMRERLIDGARRLDEHIARLPAERLDEIVSGGEATFAGTLHGVVAHHLYHAGQIALLRKAVAAGERAP